MGPTEKDRGEARALHMAAEATKAQLAKAIEISRDSAPDSYKGDPAIIGAILIALATNSQTVKMQSKG